MSVAGPSKRLAPRCLFQTPLAYRPQRRHASSNDEPPSTPPRSNPILEEYKRRHGNKAANLPDLQQTPQAGNLPSSTIFDSDDSQPSPTSTEVTTTDRSANPFAATQAAEASASKSASPPRDAANLSRVLDPDPNSRERWERKKIIQTLRKNSRLSKPQIIARTERELTSRSPNFKTSTKKLGMLARQIQGKTLEEAVLQMRFSKKKVAEEVRKHLEFARDEAVVGRGMGLGKVAGSPDATGESGAVPLMEPVEIQLKDGKRHTVDDMSKIYVDQAWVGRGPYGQLPDFRARGRVFIMRTPWTSLSVVLKEEKTRVRLYEEREQKRREKRASKVWVPLPDRPVQGQQRGWYCW